MSSTPFSAGYGTLGYGRGGYGALWGQGPGISYYTGLLTSEYQSASPKLIAWLTALLKPLDDITQCLASFESAFDLDFAVGVQLDMLGQFVGVARTVPFQPSGGVSPTLDDPTYRLLLKSRVAWNHWDGTIDGLQTIWQKLFPGGTIAIIDSQNMTASVLLTGAFSSIIVDLINNGMIVPRPAGVLYTFSFATLPIFGFDQAGAYIAGFDQGHFA